jgi:hypothetical protein
MMAILGTWEGAVGAAPLLNVTGLHSTATPSYPVAGIGSTEYAARIIAVRCRLSPAFARMVVELCGMGGGA